MTLDKFCNCLRVLRSIDLHELQVVGLWTEADETTQSRAAGYTWDKWRQFRSNPYEFLIRCDDEIAAKIWAVIQKRLKPDETTMAEAISKLPGDMVVASLDGQELTAKDVTAMLSDGRLILSAI